MLFGGAFQSPQRVGWPSDEPPAEDFLDELSPPAWREDEVSVEGHAARVRVDRCDLNLFVVRDTKGQPHIERELPRRTHVEHVESDAQPEGSKNETIARAHWAREAFDQLEPGPLRQFARVCKQEPNALGGGEEDLGRADFHRSVSLTVRLIRFGGNLPKGGYDVDQTGSIALRLSENSVSVQEELNVTECGQSPTRVTPLATTDCMEADMRRAVSSFRRWTFVAAGLVAAFLLGGVAQSFERVRAQSAVSTGQVFEIRTYTAPPGKVDALHARFRDHTIALFRRHGIESVAYFKPLDAPASTNTLIYILAHPSREAAKANWAATLADPDWQAVKAASERDGSLTTKIESVYVEPADYSPMK